METIETNLQAAEQKTSSRRAAILMGGAALATLAFSRQAKAEDLDPFILNFALNLEYLEAQYYTLATQGKTIDQVGVEITGVDGTGADITPGTVTTKAGGPASCLVPFTTPLLQQFAMETAAEERNHVTFLRAALGHAQAVAMPSIDFVAGFNSLWAAAGLGDTFDPFADETSFLLGAFFFEDLGVTAYHGAAGLITDKTYLDKAAGILAVEAYHAGSIRTRIFKVSPDAQSNSQAIAGVRASRGTDHSTTTADIGVGLDSTGAATIVDADANAIAFSRTTTQVIQIVYGGDSKPGTAASGAGPANIGFFPNKLNGVIQ